LKTRGSVFLSEISYSIYLLHAVVLYLSFSIIWPPQESQSQEGFMMLTPVIGIAVVLISTLTYSFIEKPFMNLGKKLSRKNN
ncbi:MAG: hypothetical protein MI748_03135, partial [Opitutales bacterium]|nr:hypothetical protein [Opitutales bacterium]